MSDEKLLNLFTMYKSRLSVSPNRADIHSRVPESEFRVFEHLVWMCKEAIKFVYESRREKAMRWLGFIQGVLWAKGKSTIEQLANDSKPAVEEEYAVPVGNETIPIEANITLAGNMSISHLELVLKTLNEHGVVTVHAEKGSVSLMQLAIQLKKLMEGFPNA